MKLSGTNSRALFSPNLLLPACSPRLDSVPGSLGAVECLFCTTFSFPWGQHTSCQRLFLGCWVMGWLTQGQRVLCVSAKGRTRLNDWTELNPRTVWACRAHRPHVLGWALAQSVSSLEHFWKEMGLWVTQKIAVGIPHFIVIFWASSLVTLAWNFRSGDDLQSNYGTNKSNKHPGAYLWDSSAQFISVTPLCLTLCDPMQHSILGFSVLHYLLEICSNSCPSRWWCYPTISSSVIYFSSCPGSL